MGRFLFACLLFLQIRDISSINCTEGFTDGGTGVCRSAKRGPTTQYEAYACCAAENAYLSTVKNAYDNTNLASQVSYAFQWLGLTCTGSQKTSCLWDNGVAITDTSYTNFMLGHPNTTIGACVAMNPHGQWYSIPCGRGDESASMGYYFCQSTPGVYVPSCPIPSFYFRGHCYYPLDTMSYGEAADACSGNCGHVASIHNEGENSYVRDIALSNNAAQRYSFIGLTYSSGLYRWNDYTQLNYVNFGYNNTKLGSCVIMATQGDDIVPQGQWMSTDCNGRTVTVCKSELGCTTPTQAPLQCSGTQYLSGDGDVYSPGYPLGSEANHCQYVISEDPGLIVTFTVDELSLDGKSTLQVYNSPLDIAPFVTFDNSSKISNGTIYYSAGNFLWIVFETPGNIEFRNRWKLTYDGTTPTRTLPTTTTPTTTTSPKPVTTTMTSSTQGTTTTPPPSLNCLFVIDWLYLGSSDDATVNTAYLQQRDFVNTVASQLYATPEFTFGADVSAYGYSDAGITDPVKFDHYILNDNNFNQSLSTVSPNSWNPFGLCDEQDALNPGNPGNLENIGRDCLVFFSGESDTDFSDCTSNPFLDPLDTSAYSFIVGAGLNGQIGVQSISNTTVPISNNFGRNDVSSLVTAILNLGHSTRGPVVCREEYLNRDVIYMFEDTVTDTALSTMIATFLNTLIPLAQRDLRGSGKDSLYSNFSILPFPDSDDVCLGMNCNFGQAPLSAVSTYTGTFLTAASIFTVEASPSGINYGLIFSQNLQTADGTPRNDGRNEIIVLFANSGNGVAAAQATARSLMNQNVGIITVAVGGQYKLGPLSSPGFPVHLLDSTTDPNQLAREIITDMASLGTTCIV